MLNDRHIGFSLNTFLAWLLWAAVVTGLALAFKTGESMWAYVGLAASAAAATVHMRSFMCVFSQRMKAAFELGREVERQHQATRDLRSV